MKVAQSSGVDKATILQLLQICPRYKGVVLGVSDGVTVRSQSLSGIARISQIKSLESLKRRAGVRSASAHGLIGTSQILGSHLQSTISLAPIVRSLAQPPQQLGGSG